MPRGPRGRAVLLCCALVMLAGCADRTPPPYRAELLVFGGPASLELRGVQPDEAEATVNELAVDFAGFDRDWHPWRAGVLTTVNAAFARGIVADAPDSLLALVERSRAYRDLTDGLFDPAIGGLVHLWGFHTSDYPVTTPPPAAAELDRWLAAAPTLADVEVLAGGRLRSRNPTVQLDFGAIAEGVAAEHAARVLAGRGIGNALVSLGGDVLALGRADGRAWQVAIRDPFGATPEDVLGAVELVGHEALFTSGGYSKFREAADGARWPHLLDPRTARPANDVATVSVLHPDPVLADVAATALFIAGPDRFAALAARLRTGCVLLLTDRDELLLTTAMQARLVLHRVPRHRAEPVAVMDACAD